MRRIAILAVYDSEGVVHEYLEYYIQSLCEVVSDIIIAVIGYMKDDSLEKLKKYSSEIYIKDNKGYDAAAYKFVIENYLKIDRLNEYDELILSNDTCFGPFIPFKSIFQEMDNQLIDFWGLKYVENNYLNHLQANFLVFNKVVFRDLYEYFEKEICSDDNKKNVVVKFEMRLFSVLVEKGFRFGHYGLLKNYTNYTSPDYCIIEEHYPLMKKRCFEKGIYSPENCSRALDYLRKHTSYDVTMILDYVKHKYGIEKIMESKESRPNFIKKSKWNRKDIQLFCKENKQIYIYGTAYIAARIYGYYRDDLKEMLGFIVSDDYMVAEKYMGQKVFRISEIENKMAGIIVGVSKAVTEDIRPLLSEYKNVLYLW